MKTRTASSTAFWTLANSVEILIKIIRADRVQNAYELYKMSVDCTAVVSRGGRIWECQWLELRHFQKACPDIFNDFTGRLDGGARLVPRPASDSGPLPRRVSIRGQPLRFLD